jgi:acyl-CoA reductase-like NAD-dependent aldehyde dehydrogenase
MRKLCKPKILEAPYHLDVATIRECERQLTSMAVPFGGLRVYSLWNFLVRDDSRIKEWCAEPQRDYRSQHAAAIALELEAFDEWTHMPDPDEARILEKLADEISKRH